MAWWDDRKKARCILFFYLFESFRIATCRRIFFSPTPLWIPPVHDMQSGNPRLFVLAFFYIFFLDRPTMAGEKGIGRSARVRVQKERKRRVTSPLGPPTEEVETPAPQQRDATALGGLFMCGRSAPRGGERCYANLQGGRECTRAHATLSRVRANIWCGWGRRHCRAT